MTWVWISLLAYFLFSVSSVLDKMLLKKRIPRPSVYAFYISILGLVSFVLAPFGLKWIGFSWFLKCVFAGGIFTYAMLSLFYAVRKSEVSKVVPLVNSFIQMTTFLISLGFSLELLSEVKLVGFFLLLFGGFFISFDLPIRSIKVFSGFYYSFLSGFLLGVSYSLFGHVYFEVGFVSGFVWTRLGLVLGGLSLFVFPSFRKDILRTLRFKKTKGKRKEKKGHNTWFTIFLFFANKAFSTGGSVLMNYAFSIGAVVYVQSMASVQFVFVLILATLASVKRPDIFEEKLSFMDWAQKIISIIIIGLGVILISL